MKARGGNVKAGEFTLLADFYQPNLEAEDGVGNPTREPELLWEGMYVSQEPYLGLLAETDLRDAAQRWSTMTMRWFASRRPAEGMLIRIRRTGETWEIRGFLPGDDHRKFVQMTCRYLR